MKWKGKKGSNNIEDRRSSSTGGRGIKFSGPMLAALVFGLGIYTVYTGDTKTAFTIVSKIIQMSVGGSDAVRPMSKDEKQLSDNYAKMVSVVLADLESTWNEKLKQRNIPYSPTTLVLYRAGTNTACGYGASETGPFYCPGDQKIYLDLDFINELERLGARGDFALAYVLAHETGHHIQTLLNITTRLREKQSSASTKQKNLLQVEFELQADCFAGIWTNQAQRRGDLIESGDIEEGMKAASVVGDDYLQRRAGQRVNPESFTHGSSKERMQAFTKGLETGSIDACI